MEDIFNINELTKYLHCSESTVRKLIRNRKIPNFRVGYRIFFRKRDIDKWIDNQCEKNMEVDYIDE